MRIYKSALLSLVGMCTAICTCHATAQTAPITDRFVAAYVASGDQTNMSLKRKTVFSHLVRVDNASSLQIKFGRTTLPQGTMLRMTSLQDGAVQHHVANTLKQWRNKSAWFNGSLVLVELIAEPQATPSHVTIEGALYIEQLGDDRSICGPTDDRVLSYENRDARALPIGCTAWIIDDANHTMLTAGHCTDSGASDIEVIEFNVPQSDSSGEIQHPDPSDQYATDPASLQSHYGGVGNDWAYFGCFQNTETGLTPFQAQDDYYVLSQTAPPVNGQKITITGYGVTYSPVPPELNQAQKTHTGSYAEQTGTSIAYRTDTTGGNSGSAVLNEDTGEAIGIHTNGGCTDGGGENWGNAIHNSGLQNALANPQGVCIPNTLFFDFPNGIPYDVLPNTPTNIQFSVTAGEEEPVSDSVKVILTVNSSEEVLDTAYLGSDAYEVTLPAFGCDDLIGYYFEAQGDGGTYVYAPFNAPAVQHEIVVGTISDSMIFEEHFDDGLPTDWTASGLWTTTASCTPSGECDGGESAYFGITSSCSYNNGDIAYGSLSTPAISIDGHVGDLVLTFCSALETEDFSSYDRAELYVNGVYIDQLDESPSWQEVVYELTGITGNTVQIEWRFDTVDGLYNDFRGWHVDGVRLVASSVDCDDTATCPADITGDSDVDVSDLLAVIDQWGLAGSYADINQDGIVDVSDLLEVVGSWGPCG